MLKLYILACTVIETVLQLVATDDSSGAVTAYMQKMLVLAAFIILRMTKSHLSSMLDLERGQKAYFSLILRFRGISIQDSDLPSRTAVILTQLWTSKHAFRLSDGSIDSFTLRCRNRLSMSIVFDCFWRWRREFAGQTPPYQEITSQQGTSTCLDGHDLVATDLCRRSRNQCCPNQRQILLKPFSCWPRILELYAILLVTPRHIPRLRLGSDLGRSV